MNRKAADTIGRSLARLGHLRARHADPVSSRDHIWRLLQEADGPMSLEDISALTSLHVNTIRTHLEVLQAAGQVERIRAKSNGRGRPRWLYSPLTDDPYHQLAEQLVEALDAAADPATAEAAAQRWRGSEGVAHEPSGSPDEAIAVAAASLEQLGFDVEVSPVGDVVYLGSCPYAALVAKHPEICDIHARALEQVLAATGQDVALEALDVFPRPGVCVARLRRKDVEPAWSVRGTPGRNGS